MASDPALAYEDLLQQFQRLALENQALQARLNQQAPPSLFEPKVRLPSPFDGTRSTCRGFLLQIKNVFAMHPHRYSSDRTKIGLIGSLLIGDALLWYIPLAEHDNEILEDFERFEEAFRACFDDPDRERVAANKLVMLRQSNRPVVSYISEFRRYASDLTWNDPALMEQFRRGLSDEIKDMLLNFPKPRTLDEIIKFAVDCDNRLFERRQERRQQRSASIPTHTPRQVSTPTMPPDSAIPMEIGPSRRRGPLSDAEKDHRRRANLCLYCASPNHMVRNCPNRPQTWITTNQVVENSDSLLELGN